MYFHIKGKYTKFNVCIRFFPKGFLSIYTLQIKVLGYPILAGGNNVTIKIRSSSMTDQGVINFLLVLQVKVLN